MKFFLFSTGFAAPITRALSKVFEKTWPLRFVVFSLAFFFCALTTSANAKTRTQCDLAAQQAAQEFDIPYPVLWSITRTETGRVRNGNLSPWPWTVNLEGKGYWFETKDAALRFASQNYRGGARSFDIGCFQINFKWHGSHFQSIEQMFDPYENALYAAEFLSKLYQESGNWSQAAGAYHSRTQEFAEIYISRFERIHRRYGRETRIGPVASADTGQRNTRPSKKNRNNYPLLSQFGTGLGNGSLVLLDPSETRSFISIPRQLGGS